MQLLQTDFFHSVNMHLRSLCVLGSLAYFAGVLNNSLLSRWTTVYPCIHLLKDILAASKFWEL